MQIPRVFFISPFNQLHSVRNIWDIEEIWLVNFIFFIIITDSAVVDLPAGREV